MSKTSAEIIEEIGDFIQKSKENEPETITIGPSDLTSISLDESLIVDNSDYDLFSDTRPITPLHDFFSLDPTQSLQDLEDMCEQYPSLKKSLEQFRHFYSLTIDDWKNNDGY